MNHKKEEAFKLRRKGYSYNEINHRLGIPKSTLSGWFKDLVLSPNAQERIDGRKKIGTQTLIKRNKDQTKKAWKRAQRNNEKGKRQVGNLSAREVMLIGAALYWGEGYKKLKEKDGRLLPNHPVSFLNSDPVMIKAFIFYLLSFDQVKEKDIRLQLRLYKHINESEALHYWLEVTGLSKENHKGTSYLVSKASQGKRPYNRLPYGTLAVRINDTNLFHTIMGQIDGMKELFNSLG